MGGITILDAEMVHALATPRSNKHVAALEFAMAGQRLRRADVLLVVPSTVRVEAGWDRTAPRWAGINRMRIVDHHLDAASTDVAARLRAEHGVSPADAHIGAIVQGTRDDDVLVVTSDVDDIATVTAGTGARVARI